MTPRATLVAIVLCLACLARVSNAAPSFDEQRKAVLSSPATQSEETIVALLEAGIAEQKPTQAAAVAQLWLRANVAENPLVLYHAGRVAELSGDWRSAAALYQQYLKRADLKSATAETAVLGVYTLLIDHLADPDSAYAYMRNDGHRLHSVGRARQYDAWFLDLAVRRKDRLAVSERLLACINDGLSSDLLIARYDGYFRWLLSSIDTTRYDLEQFSPEFCDSVRNLSTAITFDDELKLRLAWAVSVRQYNMAMLDAKPQPEYLKHSLAAANALLARFPRYALLVQTVQESPSFCKF
jgi:hypothetical protein